MSENIDCCGNRQRTKLEPRDNYCKNKNTIVLTKRGARKNKYRMSSVKGTGEEEEALETSITEKEKSHLKAVSRVE